VKSALGGPVLVVDDDSVSRHVLGSALKSANLDYVVAASGGEALEKVQDTTPSLVLLDLMMPEPNGYEVLKALRQNPVTKDVPVVVLTGLDADDEITKAFEAGADDFVRKPFRAAELVARVMGQLRLHRAILGIGKREHDAQVLLELTQALASNLDFRGILFTVVQRIAEVVRVDRVSVVLVQNEDVGYVVAASDDETLRDLPIDIGKYPEIRQAITNGAPLVIPDITSHPLLIGEGLGGGARELRSVAIVPIVYEGRATGVLFLRARQPFAFGEHEISLCQTLSSAMAIALRNARVMQSLRDETTQVTEARAEAERKMVSLQRYEDFFESAADGIVVIDNEGRLLFSNPKAREITGYSEADMMGKRLGDIFSREAGELAHSLRLGFAQRKFPQGVDIGVRRKDGREITIDVNFNAVLREEGAVLCSFRDVTQERAVEAELLKTKDFLQRVIDSSVDAVISADLSGRIVLFNRAAERICGIPSSVAIGKDVRTLYPEGQASEIMKMIRASGGRLQGAQTEIVDASGERVPVSFAGALIYDGKTPIGSVGLFTDLREKMRIEAKLEEAQKQLITQERQSVVAELAGATAHELNQPLTSVMNYAILLRRMLKGDSSASHAAEVIETESERMAEIVRKIGKITRYETKNYVGTQKILDLDRASAESTPSLLSNSGDAAPPSSGRTMGGGK